MAVLSVTLSELNKMDIDNFTRVFGNVIEHCQLCAAAVWACRPFESVKGFHESICNFLDSLPILGREGVLRLHPDLAGKFAERGSLTTESTKEQSSAGLNQLTEEEKIRLRDLNERYKTKFGFPFVICARENKKKAILDGILRRLNNPKETELITGIEEVKKIAFYRICDIVTEA